MNENKTKLNYSILNLSFSSIFTLFSLLFTLYLATCKTTGAVVSPSTQAGEEVSFNLTGQAVFTPKMLVKYFLSRRPAFDKEEISNLARLYVEEGRAEGINSDVAFSQMCLETGFLSFGNLVDASMHNYCGLGAIDAEHRGERFSTEELGVRAHIQHLHAYATTSDIHLHNTLIDARYKYVTPRGKAKTVYDLAGTWASDKEYGAKLVNILQEIEAVNK